MAIQVTTKTYELEGSLLEVCTCRVLCPCWVGEDPDGGVCESIVAWHIDRGMIQGVDVSGLTVVGLAHIPGNILRGNWRVVCFVDDKATPQQREALLNVWTGKLGGPVADIAQFFGEIAGVEQVPIQFMVEGGKGRLQIGQEAAAEMAPFQSPSGEPTTLHDTIFSTIPGSPAYISKASMFRVNAPRYGFSIDLENHNAIQGSFSFAV